MKTMQGTMRVILGTGLVFVIFLLMAGWVPAWLTTPTSAQGTGGAVVTYPSPDPHP